MSHTPGPWEVEEFRKGSYLVTARNAGTAREGLVAQHVPGIANARLIAAAPELFEACTLAMDVMNNEDATGLDLYECRLILTRACTKAMGVPALEFVEQELAFVARERAKMGGKSA